MSRYNSRLFKEEIECSLSTITNAADAFVAIDYDFCFLYLNQRAEKFYRKNKTDLIGMKMQDVFPEQWNFGPFQNARQCILSRKHVEINYNSPIIKDWVQLIGRPFENYYTLTYRTIDYKEMLKKELQKEVRKSKKRS